MPSLPRGHSLIAQKSRQMKLPALEVEPESQLGHTMPSRVSCSDLRLPESIIVVDEVVASRSAVSGIQEIGMIEQIEEISVESKRHAFIDSERLADPEINISEHRSRDRATSQVGITPQASMSIQRRIIQAVRGRSELGIVEVNVCWATVNDFLLAYD